MALKEWKHISTISKFINPWWEYLLDKCYIPNGREYEYHYVHTGGSALIVPVTSDDKIIMVRQYRYLNRKFSIEFPSGGIKPGQIPEVIAHKELIEETNFDGEITKAGIFNPYNGVTDEYCYVFIAKNLFPSQKEIKDEQEEFEILYFLAEEIENMIIKNEISDGMSMAAWALVRKKFLQG